MAMIKCPECGKEISDLANKCPSCGFPINSQNQNNSYHNQQSVSHTTFNTTKQKNSGLGVAALVLSILGCTFVIGAVLAIIDLCKKNDNKKTCSIIALCVCGFWLIVVIAGTSGNNSSKQTASKVTTESSVATDAKEEKSENKDKNDAEPIKEADKKDKYYVGDTWQNKYVLVSYDSCGEYESDNQFIQPQEGNKYVYATFTFENVGSSDTTVTCWDFDCYADGFACEATYAADDAAFSQTLSSGRKISGSVYFEVPEDAEEIEFEYSPNFWTSEKIVFVYQ